MSLFKCIAAEAPVRRTEMSVRKPASLKAGLYGLLTSLGIALTVGTSSPVFAGPINLTTDGSSGMANGAIFVQNNLGPAGTGYIDSFLRIQASSGEQGYNTNYRPVQYDEKNPINYTHAVLLADVPTITLNGVKYREFFLDINERNNTSRRLITMDQLTISSGTTDKLHDYNDSDRLYHAGGTSTLLYDLDAGMAMTGDPHDNWVNLNADLQQGSGHFDMIVVIPDAYFAAATGPWLYLYSRFGDVPHYSTDAGFEEWTFGPGIDVPTPTPVPLPASAWAGAGLLMVLAGQRVLKSRKQADMDREVVSELD
jgi:hypothetical protein